MTYLVHAERPRESAPPVAYTVRYRCPKTQRNAETGILKIEKAFSVAMEGGAGAALAKAEALRDELNERMKTAE